MKKKLLLLFFLAVLFFVSSNSVSASCQNPLRMLDLNVDRTAENAQILITLTVDAQIAPFQSCNCPLGQNCQWALQVRPVDNSVNWENIPTNTTAAIDFNCSGLNCTNLLNNQNGTESRAVTCIQQKDFKFRARRPNQGRLSTEVRANCYPNPDANINFISGCVPPASGTFDLNESCNYVDVNVWIGTSGDYNILDNGVGIHNNADINLLTNPGLVHVGDGGQLDINNSEIFITSISFFEINGKGIIPVAVVLFLFLSFFLSMNLIYPLESFYRHNGILIAEH